MQGRNASINSPFKKSSLFLLSALLASGCATQHFGPLPQSGDDFKKPPAELRSQFPGVSDYPGQNSSGAFPPKLLELESQWGPAQDRRLNVAHYAGTRASLSVFFLSLIGPTATALGLGAIPWLIPPTEYVQSYEKGDYTIAVRSQKTFDGEQVTGWDWIHHATTGDTELFADDANQGVKFISRVSAEFGSGWARNKFDPNHPKLQGGYSFAWGAAIPFQSGSSHAKVLIGYRTANSVDENSDEGLWLREYPVEIHVDHNVSPRVAIGAGVADHWKTKLSRNYASDETLENTIGFVVTAGYTFKRHMKFGIKAERLTYKLKGEPSINGNSIALTLNFDGR